MCYNNHKLMGYIMKKIIFILICLLCILVSCKEKYFLDIADENLNIEIRSGENLEFLVTYTEGATLLAISSNEDIAIYEKGVIVAKNEGNCVIKFKLDEDIDTLKEVEVTVLAKYENVNNFNAEDLFNEDIIVIKNDINKQITLTIELKDEFLEKVKKITYIETFDDYSDLELLYKIKSGNNEIKVYKDNYISVNNNNYLIISNVYPFTDIYSFNFLNEYQYNETVSSGWLPWV